MRLFEINPGQRRQIKTDKTDYTKLKPQFDKIWDRIIAPNCKEIITNYQNTQQFLRRGTTTNLNIYRGKSFEGRKSKDSSADFSELFDKMLVANGMEALRSNSIFATSKGGLAGNFGDPYIIFPFDGFKFTYTNETDIVLERWSQFIDPEIYNKIQSKFDAAADESLNKVLKVETPPLSGVNWSSWEHRKGPMDPVSRLHRAIESMKIIMPNDPEIQSLTFEQLVNSKSFEKMYQPKNSNLEKAITSGVEVYIKGQYYAFVERHYIDLIWNKINTSNKANYEN